MIRTASEAPTTPIEIAKLRSTVDESPCDPDEASCVPNEAPCVLLVVEEELDEELDEDEEVVPDVVPVLPLVCDVEEIVDEVIELEELGSRTSKLSHIQSIFFRFPR
jgi:hypothetical protein